MVNIEEITERISDLLEGRATLEEFEDWSALASFDVHLGRDQDSQKLVYAIRSVLVQHETHPEEKDLRAALRKLNANAARTA